MGCEIFETLIACEAFETFIAVFEYVGTLIVCRLAAGAVLDSTNAAKQRGTITTDRFIAASN